MIDRYHVFAKMHKVDKEEIKDTFTIRSPSGGFHFYLSKPEHLKVRASHNDYLGIEFKTKWITAGGSYNPDLNKHYEIVRGSPNEIAKCPVKLLKFLEKKENYVDEDVELTYNLNANIEKYIDYLKEVEPAIEGANGDAHTFQVAAVGKDFAITAEKTIELMSQFFNPRCQPEWGQEDLETKVYNAYDHGNNPVGCKSIEKDFDKIPEMPKLGPAKIRAWDFDARGKLKKTLHNSIQILGTDEPKLDDKPILRGRIRYNLFSNQIEWVNESPWRKFGNIWSDEDAIHAKAYLSTVRGFEVPTTLIHEAALVIANQFPYHPIRDYLKGLVWDGVPRLETVLIDMCGAEDNKYVRFVTRKTFVAAVHRVFRPGCKYDHVLVLEGDQGIGKSSFFSCLFDPWFTDSPIDPNNKDSIAMMQGNWCVEMAEMSAVSKYKASHLREFITRRVDRCRPAYGKTMKDFPRQNILVGTVNPESHGYLVDPTGNRRYFPVEVKYVNQDGVKNIKDQLWAEAYYNYFEKNEIIHVDTAQMQTLVKEEVEKREQQDPWHPLVYSWLQQNAVSYVEKRTQNIVLQPIDVYVQAIGGSALLFSQKELIRVATTLVSLGFVKKRSTNTGAKVTNYVIPLEKFLK